MFQSIVIKNSFIKDISIDFKSGLNVIMGGNGSGKSSILEYLSYALFGSIALRSPLKEYPEGFYVSITLLIDDTLYRLDRRVKACSLLEHNGESYVEIVRGTTPVNNKIKELLGYDYSIYLLTNFIRQHDLLNLTSSSPTQLLNLIEYVSGLSSSYRLEAELKLRRKEAKIEEDALKSSIKASLSNLNEVFVKEPEFEALIEQHKDPLKYLRETGMTFIKQMEELSTQIYKGEEIREKRVKAELTLKNLPELGDKEECQREYEACLETESTRRSIQSRLGKAPDVEYTQEYLDEQEELVKVYTRYLAEVKLKRSLKQIECPNCKHTFYNTTFEFTEEPEKPTLTLNEISKGRDWLRSAEEYRRLEKELQELPTYDREGLEKTLKQFKLYEEAMSILEEPELPLEELKAKKEEISEAYNQLEETKTAFSDYILKKLDYEKKKGIRDNFNELLEDAAIKRETYQILHETLKEVKCKVQATILPKLNHVASQLLALITYEERSRIEITDDFRLLVDDQPVSTLEGSAQVLVNIALRYAMLNTFYSDYFLVSLQDEVDAPLATGRFEGLSEAYRQLALQGFQLIVISHKKYDHGNIINLEEGYGLK